MIIKNNNKNKNNNSNDIKAIPLLLVLIMMVMMLITSTIKNKNISSIEKSKKNIVMIKAHVSEDVQYKCTINNLIIIQIADPLKPSPLTALTPDELRT